MIILAIETSCDETAAAILEAKGKKFSLLANIVSSQIAIHKKYGGVVPEVAARKHIEMMIPVIERALKATKKKISEIDVLAVTGGPGLNTSLLVGTETAKAFSYLLKKPLVSVNHIEAHLYSPLLDHGMNSLKFPAVALIVSGGHTEIILMRGHGSYKLLGQTMDDAAGESFDKVAKILGLEYPGGPVISSRAEKGDPEKYKFPRPMIDSHDLNFSFSGLKTAVLYTVKDPKSKNKKLTLSPQVINNLCASFQQAVVDVLTEKTIRAAKLYKARTVMLGGGVSANKALRKNFETAVPKELPGAKLFFPSPANSTDNAAMIAMSAYFRAKEKKYTPWNKIKADPNLRLA